MCQKILLDSHPVYWHVHQSAVMIRVRWPNATAMKDMGVLWKVTKMQQIAEYYFRKMYVCFYFQIKCARLYHTFKVHCIMASYYRQFPFQCMSPVHIQGHHQQGWSLLTFHNMSNTHLWPTLTLMSASSQRFEWMPVRLCHSWVRTALSSAMVRTWARCFNSCLAYPGQYRHYRPWHSVDVISL
jgi:hypothetical protein